jgi:hypothetical protein
MVKYLLFLLTFSSVLQAAPPRPTPNWQAKVASSLPLLGHRNWILVVDSAYPLQVSPGIETIETNASQLDVLRNVLAQIDHYPHISPNLFMDAELPFLTDETAPGVSQYRAQIKQLLQKRPVQMLPHEQIISNVDTAGRTFHILVLKTTMTIPYTSVFLQLDCKYWTADQEKHLRESMRTAHP